MKYLFLTLLLLPLSLFAEDGSRLWLPEQQPTGASVTLLGSKKASPTIEIAMNELKQAWRGVPVTLTLQKDNKLVTDGFCLRQENGKITLLSSNETGLLYGAYHLLRLQETEELSLLESGTPLIENPAYPIRILNHWDNLDRSVERGYAGESLWNWEELPDVLSDRYETYARANASLGINGTILNNVNASPKILTEEYLQKVKALADVFRPYGIHVYLSVNFASPIALDNLSTADPLDRDVIRWWKNKVKEIYTLIPDFGGFIVKANSEGQPGPNDYGRTHADGANMLADALKPYKGVVIWRAFVYSPNDADRAKQAYLEFQPLDGAFLPNVIIQVKNGPIDFQPREPYSPLFTSIKQTALAAELQITQEYLGHSNHLVFLAPMWREFFDLIDSCPLKAVSGVANTGTDTNWCGHIFAQANWYAFGRLAWNSSLSSEKIADEWLKQTFTTNAAFVEPIKELMLESREATVNYMTPLGLHHIMASGHHYGPEPWSYMPGSRPDWLPAYYHQADAEGIGFDRSSSGSDAVSQYPEELAKQYDSLDTCPEEYLLWFHHLPWTHIMKSGRTLWEELCLHYDQGVQQVRTFQKIWDKTEGLIDAERFHAVQEALKIQVRDAVWWKDACLLYFQEFNNLPIPYEIERPIHNLDELKQVRLRIRGSESPSGEMLNKSR